MPESPTCQTLTEHIADWIAHEVQVDPENRIVKNVALTGLESRNGYRYSEEALSKALPLYEQKPVFLDHAASRTHPHQRSTRDLVGSVVNVRYEGGRIRGDIRVIDTEAGRTFLALAESNGPAVGMSHVILAEKSADGLVVEKIHDVVSVDAVVFPATTQSFQEQQSAAESERDLLKAQIADLKAELAQLQTEREVQELLEESRLPKAAVTEVFREQLLAAPSAEARRRLIGERETLLDSLARSQSGPFSRERLPDPGFLAPSVTDEQFLAALRRF